MDNDVDWWSKLVCDLNLAIWVYAGVPGVRGPLCINEDGGKQTVLVNRLRHTSGGVMDVHFPWEKVDMGVFLQCGENLHSFDGRCHVGGSEGGVGVWSLVGVFGLTKYFV